MYDPIEVTYGMVMAGDVIAYGQKVTRKAIEWVEGEGILVTLHLAKHDVTLTAPRDATITLDYLKPQLDLDGQLV